MKVYIVVLNYDNSECPYVEESIIKDIFAKKEDAEKYIRNNPVKDKIYERYTIIERNLK